MKDSVPMERGCCTQGVYSVNLFGQHFGLGLCPVPVLRDYVVITSAHIPRSAHIMRS